MYRHKQLADLIVAYIASRRDKKAESFYKDKPKRNRQGKVMNGAVNIRLAEIISNIDPDAKDKIRSIEQSKKDKQQTPLDFQQQKYEQLMALLPEHAANNDLLSLKSELHEFLMGLEDEFDPVFWLNSWTPKASDISFATHVAKLTHSSSKGSSILDSTTEKNDCYLTTSSLSSPEVDTASSNAASLPVADILKLSVDGLSVLNCIQSGDNTLFKYLTDDDDLIGRWCENLRQAYDSRKKSSYFLNKQIYFPLVYDEYHLLLPLASSSLLQAMHLEHQKYYTGQATEARKQKKEKLYSPAEVRSYPNKAYIHVTGSNHSNASSLNGQRGGRMALLAAFPPQWRSGYKSIENQSSLFNRELSYRLKNQISELKNYLLVLKKENLSIGKPERNAAVVAKLKAISDTFFDYITEISLQETAGWTITSDLSIEQQLLLEPNREDEAAKSAKLAKHWFDKLSDSYARWLNRQLKNKHLDLGKIQKRLWQEHFLLELKTYIATVTTLDAEGTHL